MRPALRLPAALSALTATFLALGAPALSVDLPPERPVITGEEALRQDATPYAAEYAVSLDEAVRRLSLQPELGRFKSAGQMAAGDRFAGGWTEHAPEYRLVFRLQGPGSDAAVRAATAGAPVPVEIRAGVPHSLEGLLAALDRIAPTVVRDLPDAGLEVDVTTGSVVVLGRAISQGTLRELEVLAGVPVRFEEAGEAHLDHTYGGMPIGSCTTGYTVRNTVTGVTGVTTAGHCASEDLTYRESSVISYPADYMGERWDDNQDGQWHTTSHPEFPQFWSGSALRTVARMVGRAEMMGDWVCKYGVTTGYSCGQIVSLSFSPPPNVGCRFGYICQNVWARVESSTLRSFRGDSGGPWFNAGDAYGIHTGSDSTGTDAADVTYAYFMTIGFLQADGMSLTVLLGG